MQQRQNSTDFLSIVPTTFFTRLVPTSIMVYPSCIFKMKIEQVKIDNWLSRSDNRSWAPVVFSTIADKVLTASWSCWISSITEKFDILWAGVNQKTAIKSFFQVVIRCPQFQGGPNSANSHLDTLLKGTSWENQTLFLHLGLSRVLRKSKTYCSALRAFFSHSKDRTMVRS